MSRARRLLAILLVASLALSTAAAIEPADDITLSPAEDGTTAVRRDSFVDVAGTVSSGSSFIARAEMIGYDADGNEVVRQEVFGRNTPASESGGESYLDVDGDGTVDGRVQLECEFGDATSQRSGDRVHAPCEGQTDTAWDVQLVMEMGSGEVFYSDALRVDAIPPVVEGYEVIDPNTIRVTFSEPITHPTGTESPSDWRVRNPDGSVSTQTSVVAVTGSPGDDCDYAPGEDTRGGTDGCTRLLTVSPALDRDATPRIDYFPQGRGLHRDGAANTVLLDSTAPDSRGADADSLAADRVGPETPTIDEVDGQPAQDPDSGERVVVANEPAPTVLIGNVADGYPVTVYVDGAPAGSGTATGPMVEVTLDPFATPEPGTAYELTATSEDDAACDPEEPSAGTCRNESEPSVAVTYDLDTVAPTLVGNPITRSTTIAMEFTEPLLGTDDPSHWTVMNPGGPDITVTAVDDERDDGIGGDTEPSPRRTLTFEGGDLVNDATLSYAPASGRYADEHGNPVADFDVGLDPAPLPVVTVVTQPGAETDRSVAVPNPVTFTLELSEPADTTVTIDYVTVERPGGAAEGDDYEFRQGTVTFEPDEQVSDPIDIAVVGDAIDEDPEAVGLELSNPQGARFPDGTEPLVASELIEDDDPEPNIGFDAARYDVTEGDAVTVTVELTDAAGAPISSGKEVRVDWTTRFEGSADTSDAPEQSGEVVIPAGQTTGTFIVETLPDNDVEGDEIFDLDLSGPVNAVLDEGASSAEVDILNDDVDVPTVSVAGRSNDEDDPPRLDPDDPTDPIKPGAVEFEISLNRAVGRSVTVPWSTGPGGTATADEDFEPASGEVTFQPGDVVLVVEVPIIDDALDEDDETVELLLGDPGEDATVDVGTALGTIIDDDPEPTAQFSVLDVTTEEGEPATLTVQLDAESGRDVTVEWATRFDGDATATDADAPATSGSVVIAAGSTTETFQVDTTEDTRAEADESFFVDLTAATHGQVGDDATATVTIEDDEVVLPTISVTQDPVPSTAEDDLPPAGALPSTNPHLAYTLTLDRAVDRTVTVEYRTPSGSGTARAPADFTATSGTVTFPANSTEPQTVLVEVVDDGLDEFEETVQLLLSDPVGARLQGGVDQLTALGTITDDDPPVEVALDSDARTVTEGEAADFTVELSQPSGKDVTVRWRAVETGGGATADSDFSAATGLVTIPAGQASDVFSVATTDDTEPEAAEEFDVELEVVDDDDDGSNDPPATLGDPAVATVTISASDQDLGGVPVLALSSASVTEGTPPIGVTSPLATTTMTFDLTLSEAPGEGEEVTVTFSTSPVGGDAGATPGEDYTAVDGETRTFGTGETSTTIEVNVFPDAVDEFDERFELVLTGVEGDAQLPDDPSRTGTITDDDDPAVVGLAGDSTDIEVDEGRTATVTVELDGATEKPVSVDWTASFDADADPGDLTATSGSVTFADGASTATFEVPTADDTEVEGDESLSIVLTGATNAQRDEARDTATLTILDDEVTLPTLDVTGGETNEGDLPTPPALRPQLTWTFTLDEPTTTDVTADWATSASRGTATAGDDYTGGSGTVTIPAGEQSATIGVDVLDDDLDEFIEEVDLVVSDVSGADLDPTVDAAGVTARITDDDPAVTVQFAEGADATVDEGSAASFEVVLSGPSGKPVRVDWQTVDGSATTSDGDYQAQSGVVEFEPGDVSEPFSVSTLDDFQHETDEELTVELTVATTDSADLGGRGTATLTITDDDPLAPGETPVLGLSAGTAEEGSLAAPVGLTELTFTVLISDPVDPDTEDPVTVAYETVAGEATPSSDAVYDVGEDYVATSGEVEIADGDRAEVTVRVFEDQVDEFDEGVTLRLTEVTSGDAALPGGEVTRDARILDDDGLVAVGFDGDSLDVGTTEGGAVDLTVELGGPTEKPVSVAWSVSFDGGADGDDTTARSGTVDIPAGASTATFSVPTTDDDADEPTEAFSVVLSDPTNATLDTDADVATVTISDDDVVLPVLSVDSPTVDEGATGELGPFTPAMIAFMGSETAAATPVEEALEFTISLDQPTEVDVTVDWTTVDTGSASAGSDYTAASGTVTIPAGEQTATISIDVVDDGLDEFDELVDVRFTNVQNATFSNGASTLLASGRITDDDPVVTVDLGEDVEVTEGEPATFDVALSAVSGKDIELRYRTTNGSARAGEDFTATDDTLVIPAGDTSATFTVPTLDDTLLESTEDATVTLSVVRADTADLGRSSATLDITDDDVGVDPNDTVVSLTGDAVEEGDPFTPLPLPVGGNDLTFQVQLSRPADGDVTIDYRTVAGTATAEDDFTSASGQVTIPDGEDSTTVAVAVTPDFIDEFDEDLRLVLTDVSGDAVLPGGELARTGRILDDDPQAQLRVSDATVLEGDVAELDVTLDNPSGKDITVAWSLVDGTATAGDDYVADSGTLSFPAGTTSRTVQVATLADADTDELIEQFELVLSGGTNAGIDDARGTVSIVDVGVDGLPTATAVFLEDITTQEADGDRTALVPVRLSSASDQDTTVTWSSQRLTAADGEDYRAEGGPVVIPAGETSTQIPVTIIGDDEEEPNEDFLVLLTEADGAVITGPTGRVTIEDDDTAENGDGDGSDGGGSDGGADGAPDADEDAGAGDLAATGGGAGFVVFGLALLAARRRRED